MARIGFAHGHEALEALTDVDPDLVITDGLNCPMSGAEFVRRLRPLTNVPVIFLSAWAQELEDELRGVQFEPKDDIALPFSGAELVRRVSMVLEQFTN